MKLWDKGKKTDNRILEFTIGRDRELDMEFASFDMLASMAHVIMLESVGLIENEEMTKLLTELLNLYESNLINNFIIEEDIEDIHSQVEKILIEKLGEEGKKIHTARSRNDQVLVDLKLFYRKKTVQIAVSLKKLISIMIDKGKENKDVLMPGYTHFQAAMPSSFGLWFGAYAESLVEDLMIHEGLMRYINQNPLGSAAGYGSSFPIDREMTTSLLEFDNLHISSVNAQMSRGKVEKHIAAGLGSIAASLSKMCMDMTLFMSQNFGFINLPDEFTTGSSIMPHKANPDVVEIVRAKCNRISAIYNEVQLMTQNLPSGYHRDYQLLKEIVFPAYKEIEECIKVMGQIIRNLIINKNITEDIKYLYIFSVENVNEKVKNGVPFREAYAQVANEIGTGKYSREAKVKYTHTGSIGNPGFDKIEAKLDNVWKRLEVGKYVSFEERFINKVREI